MQQGKANTSLKKMSLSGSMSGRITSARLRFTDSFFCTNQDSSVTRRSGVYPHSNGRLGCRDKSNSMGSTTDRRRLPSPNVHGVRPFGAILESVREEQLQQRQMGEILDESCGKLSS